MKSFTQNNSSRKALFWLCLVIVAMFILVGVNFRTASAQQSTPSADEVNAIAKQMYCPVCENIPLDVCPTTACAKWRELIKTKLSEGWSEQQIKDYFVAQYGDRVLAEPPRVGLNWLVYILPVVFFLAGVAIVILVLRKMRTTRQNTASPPPPVSDDPYLTRLEDELHRRDNV